MLDGVEAVPVDTGLADPPRVDVGQPAHHLGPLGPQVVEAVEVAVLAVLPGEGRVSPVVVHRRIVEPRRLLDRLVGRGREDRCVRERLRGRHRRELAAAVVERAALRILVRGNGLVYVVVFALGVADHVGGVVGDDVEEHLEAALMSQPDQLLELVVGAEVRVDLGEVGDPVAVVAGRDVVAGALHGPVLEDRGEPDRGRAEALDVVQLVDHAGQVAAVIEALIGRVETGGEPVAGQAALVVGLVAVGEAVRQDEVVLLVVGGLVGAPLRDGGIARGFVLGRLRRNRRQERQCQCNRSGQEPPTSRDHYVPFSMG